MQYLRAVARLLTMRFLLACALLLSLPPAASAERPARIVSMMPSNTEILFELGAGGSLVGVTSYCDYPPEARKLDKVGDFIHPNFEKIITLKPDLVLAGLWKSTHIVPRLRRSGIRVIEVPLPSSLDQIYDSIGQIAAAVGREKEGEELVGRMRARAEKITAAASLRGKAPSFYIEIDPPNWTVSRLSFINDAVERCGARNIFRDLPLSGVQISWETVVERDPDVILVFGARRAEVAGRPGWSRIRAVQNGHVLDDIGKDFLNRPTPRILEGMERISRWLDAMGY